MAGIVTSAITHATATVTPQVTTSAANWRPTYENFTGTASGSYNINLCNELEEKITQLVQSLHQIDFEVPGGVEQRHAQILSQIITSHKQFQDNYSRCATVLERLGPGSSNNSTGLITIPKQGFTKPPRGNRLVLKRHGRVIASVNPEFNHLESILAAYQDSFDNTNNYNGRVVKTEWL